MAASYKFGTFTLDDGGTSYLVRQALPPASPIDSYRMALAAREGSVVAQRRYTENGIKVLGTVRGATFTLTEGYLDALITALNNGVQHLTIGYVDDRYWLASLAGQPLINKLAGVIYEYEADFLLADPFAYAASASQSAPGLVALA